MPLSFVKYKFDFQFKMCRKINQIGLIEFKTSYTVMKIEKQIHSPWIISKYQIMVLKNYDCIWNNNNIITL